MSTVHQRQTTNTNNSNSNSTTTNTGSNTKKKQKSQKDSTLDNKKVENNDNKQQQQQQQQEKEEDNKLDIVALRFPIFCCSGGGKGLIAAGGGGGTAKTGIPNGVSLFKWAASDSLADHKFIQLGTHDTKDCIPYLAFHEKEDIFAYGINSNCYIVEYSKGEFIVKKEFSITPEDKDSPLNNHKYELCQVKFSKNSDRLVTIGSDGLVRVWSLPSYSPIKSLPSNHADEINDFDIHPSSSYVVTTAKDKTCKILNILNGRIEKTLSYSHKDVALGFRGCRFSPDGLYLYTAQSLPRNKSFKGCTVVSKWGFPSGKLELSNEIHSVHNTSFEISPNGKYLAIGTADSMITVIDTETLKRVDRWEAHGFIITGVCFSPDNDSVFSVSADYTAKSHKIGSGKKEQVFKDDYIFYEFKGNNNKIINNNSNSNNNNNSFNLNTNNKESNSPMILVNHQIAENIKPDDLNKDELFQLGLDLMHSEKGVKIQKKKKNFLGNSINCFTGSQLIDWLVKKLDINRKDAIIIGTNLMNLNIFYEVGVNPTSSTTQLQQPQSSQQPQLSLSPNNNTILNNNNSNSNTNSTVTSPSGSISPLNRSTSLLPPLKNLMMMMKSVEDSNDIFYEFLTKPESIINHVAMKKLDELCLAHKSLNLVPITIINTAKYLKILDLSFNHLVESTNLESIPTLPLLEVCNLSHNQLNNLPSSFNKMESLLKLNLNNNNFVNIPLAVFQIPNLEELSVASNQLISISESISFMQSIQHLDLRNNKITKIPKEIGLLPCLKSLNVAGYNKITELPAFLSSISTLKKLEFPDSVKIPPRSITSKGFQDIMGYLKDMFDGTVNYPYLKLFVLGSEKTGKTSLIKSLVKSHQKSLTKQGSTILKKVTSPDLFTADPLEINEWKLDLPASTAAPSSNQQSQSLSSTGGPSPRKLSKSEQSRPEKRTIKLHTYDFKFSNPDVYYSTHQFYLSERAFYLITFDINRDPLYNQLDFWVNSIRHRSPNAPIYLVATHIDTYHGSDIMKPLHEVENFLNQRCLDVTGVIGVSTVNQRNIDLLKQEIISTLTQQSWINETVPSIYVTLENSLQEESRKRQPPIVSWDEYQSIAKLSNFTSTDKLVRATNSLTRNGSIMWFDDEKSSLRDIVILNPQWLSDCFGSLLTARHTLIGSDAILNLTNLKNIWKPSLIPEQYHIKLIKIFERFQIIYTLKQQQQNGTNSSTTTPSSNQPPLLTRQDSSSQSLYYNPTESHRSISAPLPMVSNSIDSMGSTMMSSSLGSFIHPSLIEHLSSPLTSPPSTSPKVLRHSLKNLRPLSTSAENYQSFVQFYKIIIPCLLPHSKPAHFSSLWETWSGAEEHQIGRYYQFNNSPKSCFDRLMVRFLCTMEPIIFWSAGILFRKPQNMKESLKNSMSSCATLVEYDIASQQLQIRVRGHDFDSCAKLFQIILENVDTIVKDFQFNQHQTYVPCSCSVTCRESPHLFPIDMIESCFSRGDAHIKCSATQKLICLDKMAPDITLSSVPSTKRILREELTDLEEIGVGGFAKVFKGVFKGAQTVAIKKINLDRMDLLDTLGLNSQTQFSILLSSTGSNSTTSSSGTLTPSNHIQIQRNSSTSSLSSTTSSSDDSSILQNKMMAINEFRREVWLMSDLAHENIVMMKGFCFDPYSIVMEYMDLGSLSSYLHKKKLDSQPLSWNIILKIAIDIASGMAFLHNITPPLVHRDLKSPNILLATQPTEPFIIAKVSDFGLSRTVVQSFVSKVVDNPTWLAPEVLKGSEYNERADVYSFGMILWELYHLELPFDEYQFKFMSTLEDNILNGLRPSIHQNCNNTYASLITKCWNSDPNIRPTFQSILKTLEDIKLNLK
eukprot:gene4881-6087_t